MDKVALGHVEVAPTDRQEGKGAGVVMNPTMLAKATDDNLLETDTL